jgi:small subunit ribosomal protein S20
LANTRQAKKRIRVNARKRLRGLAVRSAVKTAIKKASVAIESKTSDAAAIVKEAIIAVDKAANKKIMHKNTAARKKSRLMRRLNKQLAEVKAS